MNTWRCAARLALREVRRRPGRTALVVLLIAIPVFGMTVASSFIRTKEHDDPFARFYAAGADLLLEAPEGSAVDMDALADALPADAIAWTAEAAAVPLETTDERVTDITDFHVLSDGRPLRRLENTAGRLPAEGEVWLSRQLLEDLDLAIGDTLELQHPAGRWLVVGTGDLASEFGGRLLMLSELPDQVFTQGTVLAATLVDLPAGTSQREVVEAFDVVQRATTGLGSTYRGLDDSLDSPEVELAWSWVAGAIALAITGIVVTSAFATSARRQLVTIGLLSSNGAAEQTIRRSLVLQGTWSSAAGSLLGVACGLVAVLTGGSLLERAYGRPLPSWQFSIVDLAVIAVTGVVAGTVAAGFPARSASTVPVMSALAGRRPLGAVPRRLVPAGLGAFGLGVVLLVAAAGSEGSSGPAVTAVVGALLVLAGVCCCMPLATDAASRLCAGVGRSWRFAGRSLGRTRSRTAAVVTAIAVTSAGALAGSVGILQAADNSAGWQPTLPADAMVVIPTVPFDHEAEATELPVIPVVERRVDDTVRARVEQVVPGARWHPRFVLAWEPAASLPPSDESTFVAEPHMDLIVATPELLDLYELSEPNRRALHEVGVLALYDFGHPGTLVVPTESGRVEPAFATPVLTDGTWSLAKVPGMVSASGIARDSSFLITPEAAAATGLETVEAGAMLRTSQPLTDPQHAAIVEVLLGPGADLGAFYRDIELVDSGWAVTSRSDDTNVPGNLLQLAVVGAALLLTLIVVAIGLSLAAAESRDERDVLVAVGARPRTMRSMAGAKAVVMTLTGVAAAIPAALIPMLAVSRALDEPFHMPWLALGGLLVVIPIVVGLAATAASSIGQRFRPVTMSNLAVD